MIRIHFTNFGGVFIRLQFEVLILVLIVRKKETISFFTYNRN